MTGRDRRELAVAYVGGVAATAAAIATILSSTSGSTPAYFGVLGVALLLAVPTVIVLARRGVPRFVDRQTYLVFAAMILGAATRLMQPNSSSAPWLDVLVLGVSITGVVVAEWKLSQRRAVVQSGT